MLFSEALKMKFYVVSAFEMIVIIAEKYVRGNS